MVLLYLFNFTTRKAGNINIILKYLLWKTTDKKLNKKRLYLIILINLKFEILIILDIKIIIKLDYVIY